MTDITGIQSRQQQNSAILVDSVFDSGNYLNIHRIWMRHLGYRQAMLLALLIDQRSFHRMRGELQPDGSFYKTREHLAEMMGTGLRDVDSALSALESLGFIYSVRKGQPAKKFYHINDVKILEMTSNPDLLKSISSSAPKADLSSAPKADLDCREKQINDPKENEPKEENDPKTYTPPQASRANSGTDLSFRDISANPKTASPQPSDGTKVWECYARSFHEEYGIYPDRNAKANTIIKRAIESVGVEKACLAAAWFPKRKEKAWVKGCHPLEFFAKNLQQLVVEVGTKRLSTWDDAEISQKAQEVKHDQHLISSGEKRNPFLDVYDNDSEMIDAGQVGKLPPRSTMTITEGRKL